MKRLTARRVNGIKTGYWSAAKKDDLIQRLGELEDLAERSTKAPAGADEWISPDERLPGPYETVLISILSKNGYGAPATVETIGFYQKGAWKSYTGPILPEERVTHWMPLPEPPEGTTHA